MGNVIQISIRYNNLSTLLAKWRSLKQKADQSVQEFSDDFMDLVNQLNYSDVYALDHYCYTAQAVQYNSCYSLTVQSTSIIIICGNKYQTSKVWLY